MIEYSILISALAGLGSFFSPCILPIVPAFISYLTGSTIAEMQTANTRSSSVTSLSCQHHHQEYFRLLNQFS